MHRADGNIAAGGFDVVIKHLEWQPGLLDSILGPIQLCFGAHEDPELVRYDSTLSMAGKPEADCLGLSFLAVEDANLRRRTVKDGDRIVPLFTVTVDVRYFRSQQPVRLHPDLV